MELLHAELHKLQRLHPHGVEQQPRRNRDLRPRALLCRELRLHALHHLGNEVKRDGLPHANPAHAICSLGVIPGRAHRVAQQDHLPVRAVEIHNTVEPRRRQVQQHEPRNLQVVHACDQSSRVDECVEGRVRCRDVTQQRARRPAGFDLGGRDEGRRQRRDDLAVRSRLVEAVAQVDGQEVGRSAREAYPAVEQDRGAQLVPAGRNLHVLEVHRGRENMLAQVVVNELRQLAQQAEQPRHLQRVVGLEQRQR